MKSLPHASLPLLVALCGPVLAGEPDTPGRIVAETTFASIDANDKGYIHLGDMEQFRASVFAGMDFDDSGTVTYDEFASWDPGFGFVAADAGSPEAYTTATRIVFSFWDRDGDDALTESEMRFAVNSDFRRADINDDATLTEDEFLRGFGIIVAFRAAIRPDISTRTE